ncbi:virulence RhuM family protein [Stenotrophomonas sp. ISL-67]|uniref:virulence RhuM family protein n=1 Tax=Stenotrophomonas sp. ISL-67 TaxID=2819171 RepID=UPI001BEB7EC8|nr:virulence RhuM family protein [Stenotrophomonas sp. ISL-67]MBT2767833.1 virulence RhuM family protein [Stenotrophomonas sp. ISL-67]
MTDNHGELILYRTDDGRTEVHLRAEEGTVWLTQHELAELFDTTKQNVSLHIRNILEDGELPAEATVKDYLTVQLEGKRRVNRSVQLYRLEMILAVGFRVRSPRGSQFRRWAGSALSDYLVKGFLLNDERLKDAERADYFNELLRRIRDIRSSEKRFYQTLRDLFKASSSDYDGTAATAKTFFATIQNKLVYAITGRTAAQLIVERADPDAAHMGLTNWSGNKPRKSDAVVSKNYLAQPELEQLNRLVTMFLDFAEDRAERRMETRMEDWIRQTDRFLDFNERAILDGPGRVSNKHMEAIIAERYAAFDASRRAQEKVAADVEAELDMQQLHAETKRLASREKSV